MWQMSNALLDLKGNVKEKKKKQHPPPHDRDVMYMIQYRDFPSAPLSQSHTNNIYINKTTPV